MQKYKNWFLVAAVACLGIFTFLVFPCVGKTWNMVALAGVVVFGGIWAVLHNNPKLPV
jgi:hypothetical protein